MLGKIFAVLVIISLVASIFTGNITGLGAAALEGAASSLKLIMTLAGMMCFWGGLMNIAQNSGISGRANKAAEPLLRRVFPSAARDPGLLSAITANITANIMGIGNAATPIGLRAMKSMSEKEIPLESREPGCASADMILFVCVNCASIQLIPTTLLNLRQAAGSADTGEIIVPVWICSAVCMIFMLVIYMFFRKINRAALKN